MFKFSLFLALLVVTFAQKTRYDDYTAVRFYGLNDTDIQSFYDQNIDVWAQHRIDGWVDLMLHSNQLNQFLDLYPNYKIVQANVQDELDRHEAENEKARSAPGAQFFDYFPTYAEVSSYLDDTIAAHQGVVRSISVGTTFQGTTIRGLQIGNTANRFIYIHCTIHAREWITTTTCCHIIDQLLTTDRALLSRHSFFIVPVFNIDGYQYTHSSTRLWRKNRQTNSGSTCVGTDLNRNYQIGFGGGGSSGDPCSDTYRGARYFSGPETNGESSFLAQYRGRVASYIDIHAYGGMFMSPWGYTYTLPSDYPRMETLMRAADTAIYNINSRRYAIGSSANVIYIAAGGSDDWSYGGEGIIPSFTIEAYGTSFTPPVSQIRPVATEIWAGIKAVAAAAP